MERITEKSRSPETGYSRLIPNNHLIPPGLPLISMKEAGLSPPVIDFYNKDRENRELFQRKIIWNGGIVFFILSWFILNDFR